MGYSSLITYIPANSYRSIVVIALVQIYFILLKDYCCNVSRVTYLCYMTFLNVTYRFLGVTYMLFGSFICAFFA